MYPGAWIITGGMHTGVMKLVGEAVQEYTLANGSRSKVVAIGIATWGCVQGRQQLVNKHVSGINISREKLNDTFI